MTMENPVSLEDFSAVNGSVSSYADQSVMLDNVKESEDPEEVLLHDLDLYLETIDDHLTISRMVSDSVIKGMVNAVEQEAAEKISQKDLELARLKETLHLYKMGVDENESFGSLVMQHEPGRAEHRPYSSSSDALVDFDWIGESLGSLNKVAKEQLKNLRNEIDRIRGSSSIRRIGSGSEMVGLGGILPDKVSDIKWTDVDKLLGSLRTTFDTTFKQVDNLVCLSKTSLCQWQQEKEFQREIEDMVIMNCIRSLKEEYEERLLDQNSRFYDNLSWVDRGNGKRDESVIAVPENLDIAQLKHLSRENLVTYFKAEMTKMKRNHEQEVQEMTEEYFSLKREYFREKASSLPFKRDKEFDKLRKKIPEVILKLDGMLVENEKLPTLSENAESFCSLKDRLESLLSENNQLRGSLADKKREVKRLSLQVSDNAEIMLQHSLAEANLLKRVGNLQSTLEDAQVEASISEDVQKCFLKDIVDFSKSVNQQSELEYNIMQEVYEIIFREAAQNAECTNKCEIEDSDLESINMQELCGVIFREALREAEEKFTELNGKYINEKETRASTEIEALQKERVLALEVSEKEKLKQEMLLLAGEKENLAKEAAAALAKEKERSELVSQELDNLRDETSRQKLLISESSKESNVIKSKLLEAMQHIEKYELEIYELMQKLDLAMKELRETNEEKKMLLSVIQEMQNTALLVEAKERDHRKQMQSLISIVHGLSKTFADYEYRIVEDIKKSNLRLDNLSSQLVPLIQKANIVRVTGLMYKQKLERRCSDLQKAEDEVDLLGDEVDALLSLLEKIYIALDHYSPILQHYPGSEAIGCPALAALHVDNKYVRSARTIPLFNEKGGPIDVVCGEYDIRETCVLDVIRALRRPYQMRDNTDPFSLNDINDSNKWLMTEKTDEDFFFPKEDGLTKVPFFIKGSQVRSTYLVDEEESKEEECETEEEVEEGAEEDDDVLKEINVLGLVVTVPDITLMDTHDGGHPENFIDDMRKKGKLDGLKYTYWNRAICPRCRKLKDTDIRRAVLLHGGAAGITVWSSSSSWWSASREEPICSYGEAIC
ncbi:hypothetical protein JRO89_XS06G0001600 [Xanthoceras sorbifolium]|uniref:WPP domain-associated protein n=1 Tax=Xanthoceras sorbifolium TaxID=99658 RepID=A0ABQ8HW17_9ROSI|nr:hypothetical protein JRO89_XS06G0001600 [Xanthoceras sorbifolium]